ncbi:hypothetical protein NTH_03028 [Nitratireductor thuwali]|uniref:Uncharacterized protein n=1 Tax=Nitratireductor thuwali TaxID=2267699 RepID=A0ABY5MKL8_9HYPH|nr:hypothetical protein NTH_03028 [Nitratireductor thuwali]
MLNNKCYALLVFFAACFVAPFVTYPGMRRMTRLAGDEKSGAIRSTYC